MDPSEEIELPRKSIMPLRTSTLDTCHFCEKMTIAALHQPDGYPHAKTYEELDAVLDCKICRNLWPHIGNVRASLDRSVRLGGGTAAGIFLRIESSSAGTVLRAFLRQGNLRDDFRIEDGDGERIILVTALEGDIASETGLTWERDRMYTGSRNYVDQAAKWVRVCRDTHRCNISTPSEETTSRWPQRLLYLCHDDGAINLVPINNGTKPPYATLSYCWGPKGLPDTAKTTISSLPARQAHIDKQTLPRTFQDAISLCRSLAIDHLWIDALCIIQDSKADWQTEGSNMGSIYRNSTVTIAADSGEDAEGGLFHQLDPNDLSVKTTLKLSDGRDAALMLHPLNITSMKPKKSILQSRAWCFQERVLSPRTLHFFDCAVLFECRQEYILYNDPILSAPAGSISRTGSRVGKGLACSSEEYQSFLRDELMIDYHNTYLAMADHHLRFYQALTSGVADKLSPHIFLRPWFQTVLKDYTKRRLTFVSDKLVAISSTAREIQHQTGATYLAGLWAEDIAFGLAWKPSEGESVPASNDAPNTKSARNPTWSWTSSDFSCHWPIYESDFKWWYPHLHQTFKSHLTLLSHQIDLVSPDPFGQVSGGRLGVRGKAFRGSYTPSKMIGSSGTFDMYIRSWDGDRLGFLGVRTSFEMEEEHVQLMRWDPAMTLDRLCLLLCSKGTEYFFLALRKVEEPNVYERDCMFAVDNKAKDSFVYGEFMEWVHRGEEHSLVLV